jgi:hypothetical protein
LWLYIRKIYPAISGLKVGVLAVYKESISGQNLGYKKFDVFEELYIPLTIYAVVGVYFYQTLAVIRQGHQQPD